MNEEIEARFNELEEEIKALREGMDEALNLIGVLNLLSDAIIPTLTKAQARGLLSAFERIMPHPKISKLPNRELRKMLADWHDNLLSVASFEQTPSGYVPLQPRGDSPLHKQRPNHLTVLQLPTLQPQALASADQSLITAPDDRKN